MPDQLYSGLGTVTFGKPTHVMTNDGELQRAGEFISLELSADDGVHAAIGV